MNINSHQLQTEIFAFFNETLGLTIPEIQAKVKMDEKIVQIDTELMWKILSQFAETKAFFEVVKGFAGNKQQILEKIQKM